MLDQIKLTVSEMLAPVVSNLSTLQSEVTALGQPKPRRSAPCNPPPPPSALDTMMGGSAAAAAAAADDAVSDDSQNESDYDCTCDGECRCGCDGSVSEFPPEKRPRVVPSSTVTSDFATTAPDTLLGFLPTPKTEDVDLKQREFFWNTTLREQWVFDEKEALQDPTVTNKARRDKYIKPGFFDAPGDSAMYRLPKGQQEDKAVASQQWSAAAANAILSVLQTLDTKVFGATLAGFLREQNCPEAASLLETNYRDLLLESGAVTAGQDAVNLLAGDFLTTSIARRARRTPDAGTPELLSQALKLIPATSTSLYEEPTLSNLLTDPQRQVTLEKRREEMRKETEVYHARQLFSSGARGSSSRNRSSKKSHRHSGGGRSHGGSGKYPKGGGGGYKGGHKSQQQQHYSHRSGGGGGHQQPPQQQQHFGNGSRGGNAGGSQRAGGHPPSASHFTEGGGGGGKGKEKYKNHPHGRKY
jgi:hypothetical protein